MRSELRQLARSNRKVFYDLLFNSSAAPLQEPAEDLRFVVGGIGMMATGFDFFSVAT